MDGGGEVVGVGEGGGLVLGAGAHDEWHAWLVRGVGLD